MTIQRFTILSRLKSYPMRNFLKWILKITAITSAVLLLLTVPAVTVNPSVFPYFAFIGLFFPIILSVNLFFFIRALFLKNKKSVLIFSILLSLILPVFLDFFSFGTEKSLQTGTEFKVMSYNVRMFNRWKWIKDARLGTKIINLINSEAPDILCVQEFYSREDTLNYQDSIIKLGLNNYLISYKYDKKYTGNAIFSKFPILNEGLINIGTSNKKCIFADIVSPADTIRIYSLHLASMHLSYSDYDLIDGKDSDKIKQKSNIFSLWLKVADAYAARSEEISIILKHIETSPYPVIVCGDFNDQPVSFAYNQFSERFTDSFHRSFSGIGRTYTRFSPTFRIDYIFHSKSLESVSYKRIEKTYSDHFPILCKIGLQNQKEK